VRRVLNVSDVARYCEVPDVEVARWIARGFLRATHVSPGRWRIAVGDFLAFWHGHGSAI
jgi:hypothetical protein